MSSAFTTRTFFMTFSCSFILCLYADGLCVHLHFTDQRWFEFVFRIVAKAKGKGQGPMARHGCHGPVHSSLVALSLSLKLWVWGLSLWLWVWGFVSLWVCLLKYWFWTLMYTSTTSFSFKQSIFQVNPGSPLSEDSLPKREKKEKGVRYVPPARL